MQGRNPLSFNMKKLTQEEFIRRSEETHNKLYDYSSTNYEFSHIKVDILCKEHGIFSVTPNHHIRGVGCSKCRCERMSDLYSSNKEELVAKHKKLVGNDTYNYDKIIYKNSWTEVTLTCQIHGDFYKIPRELLCNGGSGCQMCSEGGGYKTAKEGILYVFSDGEITKVGITNSKIGKRLSAVRNDSGKAFKVIYTVRDSGTKIKNIESLLLKELRTTHKQYENKFAGYTECFYEVNLPVLLSRIATLILETPAITN